MKSFFSNLGRWSRLSVLSYRALFAWLNPRDYVIVKIMEPLAQLLFFTLLGQYAGLDPAYFALGNAVRLASVSGLYGCVVVMAEERISGTLQVVTASATPIGQTLITRMAMQGLDGVVTSTLGLTVGFFFFGLDISQVQWLWLLPALLITSYAISCLGLLVSTFGVFGVDLTFVMNFVYTMLLLFCGVNFPVTLLPLYFQALAQILPLTHGLTAIRSLVAGETGGVATQLVIEALLGLSYGLSAYFLFRYAEYRARVRGTLDLI